MGRFSLGGGFVKTADDNNSSTLNFTGPGKDFVVANGGDDTVNAGNGTDFVLGGKGNDVLNGEGGNDILLGGKGNDTLNGGANADLLDGDYGTDILTGGTGADSFEFHKRTAGYENKPGALAHDTITDFGNGSDEINLVGYDAGTGFIVDQNGANSVLLYIDFGNDGTRDLLIAEVFANGGGAIDAADVASEVFFI